MRALIVFIFAFVSIEVAAQVNRSRAGNSLPEFFRVKKTSELFDFRSARHTPVLSSANSYAPGRYWQTSTYTLYSENGRIRTTHIFDVTGQLRESRPSVSLRKTGMLSLLRVQFSFQRQPTLFTYTIR